MPDRWKRRLEEELSASFMVTDPSGQPAQGLLVGTLGESPTDSAAVRTSARLTTDGISLAILAGRPPCRDHQAVL